MTSNRTPNATLRLRLPARASHASLLRAELRLWLMGRHDGDENDILEILAAATRAFIDALRHQGRPRTIAVEVEASYTDSDVELRVHDYAGRNGNTVELQRPLRPARSEVVATRASGR